MNATRRILLLSCLALCAFSAVAQTYPTKPVRLMVGANAGGGTDIIGRLNQPALTEAMGTQVVIRNVGSATG